MSTTNTIGTSSRQYSTMALWHAAVPATPTSGYIGTMYPDTEFSGKVKITGHTTSAANFITLTTAAGQSFQDHASVRSGNALFYDATKGVGVAASSGGGGGAVIQVDNDYVTVSKLQVKIINGGAYNDGGMLISTASCTHSVIKDCIVAWTRSTNYNHIVYAISGIVANVVAYNTQAGFTQDAFLGNNHAVFINCTAVDTAGSTGKGFVGTSYGALFTNCLSVGWASGSCFSGTIDAGSDYNLSSDTTAPGTHTLKSKTAANQFTSATVDFTLKAGADAIGAGLRDGTNAPNDITGYTRPTSCDIGCWQTTVASGTLKTWNGIAKASIKTFNGVAIASVKSINGLTT